MSTFFNGNCQRQTMSKKTPCHELTEIWESEYSGDEDEGEDPNRSYQA
jgi:hypothetical protein